jgi:hypothetical protein
MPPDVEPEHPPRNVARNSSATGQRPPQRIVGAGIAGGGDDGDHIEGGMGKGVAETLAIAKAHAERDQQAQNQDQTGIGGDLRIAQRVKTAAHRKQDQHRKGKAGKRHEDGGGPDQGRGLERAEGGIMGGEPAGGDRCHGMIDGVEVAHAEPP